MSEPKRFIDLGDKPLSAEEVKRIKSAFIASQGNPAAFLKHRHPANVAQHDEASFGQRAADAVAGFMGSWRFVIIQSIFISAWVTINIVAVALRWDAYPFVLLNLVFSVQAAYASPIILLAQNRSSEHDRLRAEEDYRVNAEALEHLRALRAVEERQNG